VRYSIFANSLAAHADDAVSHRSAKLAQCHESHGNVVFGLISFVFKMDLCPRPGRGNSDSCTPLAIQSPCATIIRMYSIYHLFGALAALQLHYQLSLPRLSLTGDLTYIVSDSSLEKTGDYQRAGSSIALSPFPSSLALRSCGVSVVRRGHDE
jgi:hypothetical protein